MRILAAFCLTLVVAAVASPAGAQDWRPIGPDQARLSLAPSAFGTLGIDRWAVQYGGARYERWATRFDPTQRFFQIMLREAEPLSVIEDDLDLRRKVLENWGAHQPERIRWGDEASLAVALGTARYLPFSFSDIGCAGFLIPFGGMIKAVPRNTIEGVYCDPAFTRLPDFDIQATLNAIAVRGATQP